MSAVRVVAPGEGELIGDRPGRRVELLADHPALAATSSRFGPGQDGADLHVHRRHSDLFYVLEGELTVRLGVEDRPLTVPAGRLALVPPLVVHGFRNAGRGELRHLNLHAPDAGFADYLRGLRDGRAVRYDQEPPPADGARPVTDVAVTAAGRGAGSTVLADIDALTVVEARGGPAAAAAPPEPPAPATVRWLAVLEGEVEMPAAAGPPLRLGAGAWAQLAADAPQAWAPRGTAPARVLELSARDFTSARPDGDAPSGFR